MKKEKNTTEENFTVKDVAASLRYGRISTNKLYPLWIALMLIGGFGAVVTLIVAPYEKIGMTIGVIVFCLLGAFFGGYILVMDIAIKRKLARWLREGEVLSAEGYKSSQRRGDVKILVKFRYNGKRLSKFSDNYGQFGAYCGRDIRIVYVAKEDEVLILKDK